MLYHRALAVIRVPVEYGEDTIKYDFRVYSTPGFTSTASFRELSCIRWAKVLVGRDHILETEVFVSLATGRERYKFRVKWGGDTAQQCSGTFHGKTQPSFWTNRIKQI